MKWVGDEWGRFRWRPHYDREELDAECERIVTSFLKDKYRAVRFTLSTDDLSVLVERDTSDLDMYADLSGEGEDVEGLTDFFTHQKPAVRIAQQLSLDSSRQKRLRTTLAHEYGHVKFHHFLWDSLLPRQPARSFTEKLSQAQQQYARLRTGLTADHRSTNQNPVSYSVAPRPQRKHKNTGPRCRRSCMFDAPVSDWMEWQASYVCGAILMPITPLRNTIRKSLTGNSTPGPFAADSDPGREVTDRAAEQFDVSTDAAQVRLVRAGILY